MLKSLVSRLPIRTQQALKRHIHGKQIRNDTFHGGEPEFDRLAEWVKPGDWVLDIGANVGHYTHRLSDLVGAKGRVIAIEPMPLTFELLSANAARFRHKNVTLINVAASSGVGVVHMSLPNGNAYRASITNQGDQAAFALPIDNIGIEYPVSLIKIDVEGHEHSALLGMRGLIERDRPRLIVEHSGDTAVEQLLAELGYAWTYAPRSPNRVYTYQSVISSSGDADQYATALKS